MCRFVIGHTYTDITAIMHSYTGHSLNVVCEFSDYGEE